VIKVTLPGLVETIAKYNQLEKDIQEKALVSAINKTAEQTKNYAIKKIRADYLLKTGDIKDRITVTKATKNRIEARVISVRKGGALLLTRYSARMTVKGLSVKILKSGGRTIIKGAFISPTSKPFKRTGERDYAPRKGYWAGKTIKKGERAGQPILRQRLKTLYGPGVADILNTMAVFDELTKFADETLVKTFLNDLKYFTNKEFNK
jgi:hypothetical protein